MNFHNAISVSLTTSTPSTTLPTSTTNSPSYTTSSERTTTTTTGMSTTITTLSTTTTPYIASEPTTKELITNTATWPSTTDVLNKTMPSLPPSTETTTTSPEQGMLSR